MGVYIIAEAGVNHNGSLGLALKLCKEAKNIGADAVKFQTWKTDALIIESVEMAEYQKCNLEVENISQYNMLKELELSYHDFRTIKTYCDEIGIHFLSTPDEEESLDFLISLGVDIIKVGSAEVTNLPYLKKIGATHKRIILSTGMSTLGDIERALGILKQGGTEDISLLHCTTNYPCPMDEVNLNVLTTLRQAFQCPVGYSDHTSGVEVSVAAVALGATIIEKHFTLDCKMKGPDHIASLDPENFKHMVHSIRNIEKALGNGIKVINESERKISQAVLKKIVAKSPISKGEVLSEKNMTVKRAVGGLSAIYWNLLLGTTVHKDYNTDDLISLK